MLECLLNEAKFSRESWWHGWRRGRFSCRDASYFCRETGRNSIYTRASCLIWCKLYCFISMSALYRFRNNWSFWCRTFFSSFCLILVMDYFCWGFIWSSWSINSYRSICWSRFPRFTTWWFPRFTTCRVGRFAASSCTTRVTFPFSFCFFSFSTCFSCFFSSLGL